MTLDQTWLLSPLSTRKSVYDDTRVTLHQVDGPHFVKHAPFLDIFDKSTVPDFTRPDHSTNKSSCFSIDLQSRSIVPRHPAAAHIYQVLPGAGGTLTRVYNSDKVKYTLTDVDCAHKSNDAQQPGKHTEDFCLRRLYYKYAR